MSTEFLTILASALSVLSLGAAAAFASYFRNVAARYDPNYIKEVEAGLWARSKTETEERRAEAAQAKLEYKATLTAIELERKTDSDTCRAEILSLREELKSAVALIQELQRTVAGLTAENTTLKREAGEDE